MSGSEKEHQTSGATRSGVQELRPRSLGTRLLRLAASIRASDDVADLLERYFALFIELAPDALWVVDLLSESGIRLRRSSARLPDVATSVAITHESLYDAGLEEVDHPALRVVEKYEAYRCDGFRTLLVDGGGVIGVITCESQSVPNTLKESVHLIAASLAPHLAKIRDAPQRLALGHHLAELVRSADIPLLVLDDQGQAAVASGSFLRLIGRHDVGGEPITDFIADYDQARVRGALRAAKAIECDLAGASMVRVAFEVMPLNHPALGGAGTLLIGRDLSALRALEEQVIQSEKLATLGQLAAGVVHELNNPLTSILAYSEYLSNAPTERTDKESDLLGRIVENSQRMQRFTQSLGTYARPATGPPTRVDVGDLLDESLGFCEHIVREVDARVRVDLPAGFPGALGIRASLQQVFINLITNACHATGRGGQLRLTAELVDNMVAITVDDDGPGVAPEDRERIFEPFFSTKGEGQGTGLGLSIVRNILSLQNGTIHLDDSARGARFVVRVPVFEQP